MPFPFTWRGEVLIPQRRSVTRLRREEALDRLAAGLERERPRTLVRHLDHLDFQGGVFRWVSSWNLLLPVDRGWVAVTDAAEGLRVTYELSYRQLFVIVTAMVGIFLAPAVLTVRLTPPLGKVLLIAGAWAWLFGGNFFTTAVRFPRFIRRAIGVDPPNAS